MPLPVPGEHPAATVGAMLSPLAWQVVDLRCGCGGNASLNIDTIDDVNDSDGSNSGNSDSGHNLALTQLHPYPRDEEGGCDAPPHCGEWPSTSRHSADLPAKDSVIVTAPFPPTVIMAAPKATTASDSNQKKTQQPTKIWCLQCRVRLSREEVQAGVECAGGGIVPLNWATICSGGDNNNSKSNNDNEGKDVKGDEGDKSGCNK